MTPILAIRSLQKHYAGLRPLRIRELTVMEGERVAVTRLDGAAAELLVNLITGAALPDQGTVEVLGQPTADIASGDDWLASLDRFGIVSNRAVMMDGATLAQNLAMPFTLEIEPIPETVRARVEALAAQCGISGARATALDRPAGEATPDTRMRAHLARAIALTPRLVLFEHPTATVPESARRAFGDDVVRVLAETGMTALVMTEDVAFARQVGQRVLALNGATGEMAPLRKRWLF